MALPVVPPIKPMLAKVQTEIPQGEGWIYEPKWDGFRTIVFRDGDEIWLRSRNDRPMNRYFPEVAEMLLGGLPDTCVVDGEIIMPTDDGLDFDALQLRLHPAASRVTKLAGESPASFVAFDLIADDNDLREVPLAQRQVRLDELLDASVPKTPTEPATRGGPCLFLTPRTQDPDLAAIWFDELEAFKLEGIIAKRADLPYCAGDRVMMKIKHRRTADCVVGGYRAHKQGGVGSLLLGLYDGDTLRYVGHTAGISPKMARELFEMLEPLHSDGNTFGGDWGPGEPSRWSQGKETEWISIEPVLVCEVSYDFVQAGYRFRHAARFLRWRDDKRPEECRFDQVG